MADTMEIIISAVDQASSIFQSIVSSVTEMGSNIEEVIGVTSAEFDSMASNVTGFQEAVSNIDSSTIDELAEELGMTSDEVENLISEALINQQENTNTEHGSIKQTLPKIIKWKKNHFSFDEKYKIINEYLKYLNYQ